MAFSSWRGTFGTIKPTMRPVTGGLEDLIRMLPRGVGVIPLYNNIREGSRVEFKAVVAAYESKAAELAEAGCDLIHPGGAPPFMMLAYAGERELIAGWEAKYKVPIFTSGMNHAAALHALNVKKFVGASYFPGDINQIFAQYVTNAGFHVLDMVAMEVAFDKVQEVSELEVYKFIKKTFQANREGDGIYLLGTAWHSIDIIEMLEDDLGVPVLGYGRLVAELP